MTSNITQIMPHPTDEINVAQGQRLSMLLVLSRGSILSKIIAYLYPIISVWIVFVNSFTLFIYARYRQLHKKRNVMIISLSAVDLFTGLTQYLPKTIGRLAGADRSFTTCMAASAVQIGPPWASIFHLVAIAIERHIAITKPLLYHSIVTPARLAVALACIIAAALFFALIPLAWPKEEFQWLCLSILWFPTVYRYLFLVTPMAVAFVILFILYLHIYIIARKQEIAIAASELSNVREGNTRSNKESRATQVFILITGITLSCYAPFWISAVFLIARPESTVVIYMYYICVLCLYANSGMNFIVYAIRNSEFRLILKEMFCRKNTEQNSRIRSVQD